MNIMNMSNTNKTLTANILGYMLSFFIGCNALNNMYAGYGLLIAYFVASILATVLLLVWQCYGNISDVGEDGYSDSDVRKDICKAVAVFAGLYIGMMSFAHVKYGETEKPIEHLNGIYLGAVYTPSDLAREGITVYEPSVFDQFAFHLVDNEDPSAHTYVYTNDTGNVEEVKLVYKEVKAAGLRDLQLKIEAILLDTYGGKPTIRHGFLYDGTNLLSTWIDSSNKAVGITLKVAENNHHDDGLAQRETLSVELRTMDAIGEQ